MRYIKSFNLFEGKYDRMVGILQDDLINAIKISRKDWEDDPIDEEEHILYHVNDYTGILKDVKLFLNIRRNKNLEYKDDFEMTGTAYTTGDIADDELNVVDLLNFWEEENPYQDGTILIQVAINPDTEPQIYQKLIPELADTLRHEIEHLTQRGVNKLSKKAEPSNIRDDISFENDNQHYYYILREEIPALVHGMYKRAKWEKKPLDVVFNDFLDWLKDYGVYEEEYKRNLLFNTWKKYALKNLPDAKWSN